MGTNSRVYDDSACGKQEEWIKLLFKKKKSEQIPAILPLVASSRKSSSLNLSGKK